MVIGDSALHGRVYYVCTRHCDLWFSCAGGRNGGHCIIGQREVDAQLSVPYTYASDEGGKNTGTFGDLATEIRLGTDKESGQQGGSPLSAGGGVRLRIRAAPGSAGVRRERQANLEHVPYS